MAQAASLRHTFHVTKWQIRSLHVCTHQNVKLSFTRTQASLNRPSRLVSSRFVSRPSWSQLPKLNILREVSTSAWMEPNMKRFRPQVQKKLVSLSKQQTERHSWTSNCLLGPPPGRRSSHETQKTTRQSSSFEGGSVCAFPGFTGTSARSTPTHWREDWCARLVPTMATLRQERCLLSHASLFFWCLSQESIFCKVLTVYE